MAKIPFDIKFRPQIESGEYKVETRDEEPVEIVLWDWCNGFPFPILGRVGNNGDPFIWTRFGRLNLENDPKEDTEYDLFLITPEPELSEFEVKLWEIMKSEGSPIGPIEKFTEDDKRVFHEYSAELLSLARKELQPEKDLPRWKKCAPCDEDKATIPAWIVRFDAELAGESAVVHDGYYILFGELEKLPKEETK